MDAKNIKTPDDFKEFQRTVEDMNRRIWRVFEFTEWSLAYHVDRLASLRLTGTRNDNSREYYHNGAAYVCLDILTRLSNDSVSHVWDRDLNSLIEKRMQEIEQEEKEKEESYVEAQSA